MTETPRRVRVTSPRTRARPLQRRSVEQEIDESTGVGEVYMRSLVRTQLRLALLTVLALATTIGALPLAFAAYPELFAWRLAGVPLAWVILGAGVYPPLFALGWAYVRASERAERDFADLVERP
ncbi:hypothetical protein [Solicola sp. PLA-1-18]|uniref:hypothetical protein n=1 Tax=Solicola sp. PLA-1-18 TaxID=3380532 RepID=UPI003B77E4A1